MNLIVNNLSYGVFKKSILKEVNFKVEETDILALVGPNGSGKTTTLKCLGDIIDEFSGEIIVSKNNLDKKLSKILLFDTPIMYDSLLCKENLDLIIKLTDAEINMDYLELLLIKLNMKDKLNILFSELSLGMKKKLYLISALIQNPDILLLDEFISGLDPSSLYIVKDIIVEYANLGNIVILSTHMLDAAEKFCTKVVFINNGKSYQIREKIDEILDSYSSLEEFYFNYEKNINSSK